MRIVANKPDVVSRKAKSRVSTTVETLYVETSALLRVALEGDENVREILTRAEQLVTSALTLIEVDRGVRRAMHEKRLTVTQGRQVRRWVDAFLKSCDIIALDSPVLLRVQQDFPVEPVRTLDALHLASVHMWSESIVPLAIVSCDHRVRENARAWGYRVFPT